MSKIINEVLLFNLKAGNNIEEIDVIKDIKERLCYIA